MQNVIGEAQRQETLDKFNSLPAEKQQWIVDQVKNEVERREEAKLAEQSNDATTEASSDAPSENIDATPQEGQQPEVPAEQQEAPAEEAPAVDAPADEAPAEQAPTETP